MRCDSNFNFKKKFRKHVREQHAKKFVNNSSLLNNTVKSICKTMKKSTIIDLSASFALQKFNIFAATLKQIFESTMIFETVISSQNSHFTFSASEIVSESMKNESNQYFSVSLFSFFQTFESEHQQFYVQKFSKFCSFFTNFTSKLICEVEKKLTIIETFVLQVSFISQKSFTFFSIFKRNCSICRIDVSSVKEHYFEFFSCRETLRYRLEQQLIRRAHQREQKIQKQIELIEQKFQKQTKIEKIISQSIKNFHLIISAINFVCEIERMSFASHKLKSTRKITTCRRCNQMFNFNNKLHEHIRQNHARKSVKSFDFRVSTLEFACKIAKKSTIVCSFVSSASFASFVSQKSFIFSVTSRSQKF